jgi:hypothetical protein
MRVQPSERSGIPFWGEVIRPITRREDRWPRTSDQPIRETQPRGDRSLWRMLGTAHGRGVLDVIDSALFHLGDRPFHGNWRAGEVRPPRVLNSLCCCPGVTLRPRSLAIGRVAERAVQQDIDQLVDLGVDDRWVGEVFVVDRHLHPLHTRGGGEDIDEHADEYIRRHLS